jgi:hypothetical protein
MLRYAAFRCPTGAFLTNPWQLNSGGERWLACIYGSVTASKRSLSIIYRSQKRGPTSDGLFCGLPFFFLGPHQFGGEDARGQSIIPCYTVSSASLFIARPSKKKLNASLVLFCLLLPQFFRLFLSFPSSSSSSSSLFTFTSSSFHHKQGTMTLAYRGRRTPSDNASSLGFISSLLPVQPSKTPPF